MHGGVTVALYVGSMYAPSFIVCIYTYRSKKKLFYVHASTRWNWNQQSSHIDEQDALISSIALNFPLLPKHICSVMGWVFCIVNTTSLGVFLYTITSQCFTRTWFKFYFSISFYRRHWNRNFRHCITTGFTGCNFGIYSVWKLEEI